MCVCVSGGVFVCVWGGVCVCECVLSCVWLFVTLWTITHQAPLSMGFPKQEYCSGLPFPPPGIFQTQGSNPCRLHWQADSLPLSHERSLLSTVILSKLQSPSYHHTIAILNSVFDKILLPLPTLAPLPACFMSSLINQGLKSTHSKRMPHGKWCFYYLNGRWHV